MSLEIEIANSFISLLPFEHLKLEASSTPLALSRGHFILPPHLASIFWPISRSLLGYRYRNVGIHKGIPNVKPEKGERFV